MISINNLSEFSCDSSSSSLSLTISRYFNYMGNGIHTAGGRSGNDKHYVEQHERRNDPLKIFQKKVKKIRSREKFKSGL